MIRYQFKEEQGSLGKILRPAADVVLVVAFGTGQFFVIDMAGRR